MGAVAGVAGGSGLVDCAMPAVVKSPAARAETSTNLEFMCCVVLLQDPSGSSLSSSRATAQLHILHPLHPGPRFLAGPIPIASLSFGTNHIAAGGLLQRLDYRATQIEGQTCAS